jgi:hypothetical protein
VEHECFAVPELNQEYRTILKGRCSNVNKPRRAIQLLGQEGTAKANLLVPVADIGPRVSQRKSNDRYRVCPHGF